MDIGSDDYDPTAQVEPIGACGNNGERSVCNKWSKAPFDNTTGIIGVPHGRISESFVTCGRHIQVQHNKTIELDVIDHALMPAGGVIQVYDGSSASAPLLYSSSEAVRSLDDQKTLVYSTGSSMFVLFRAGGNGVKLSRRVHTQQAWSARWTSGGARIYSAKCFVRARARI